MSKKKYPKGSSMTFPLELMEIKEEDDLRYLYPQEVRELQGLVDVVCDQMEYDGSMMFDRCPDKVTIERLTRSICQEYGCQHKDSRQLKMMMPFVQVMLSNEMCSRRNRRKCYKKNMGKCN